MADDPKQSAVEQEALLFGAFLFLALVGVLVWFVHDRLYVTAREVTEATIFGVLAMLYIFQIIRYRLHRKERLTDMWPKPRIRVSLEDEEKYLQEAASQDSVLLGYDEMGKPFYWKNEIRSMQSTAIGSTGSGKTELLKGIFQQDVARGGPVIFIDGKGEKKVVNQLLAYIDSIGRMDDVRVLDPTHSETSVSYNPFSAPSDRIDQHVSFVFDSFNRGKSSDSFFDEHQRTYLENIARVLYHTGQRFNFYDVLVAAYDVNVLQRLMQMARERVRRPGTATKQQVLTLEMSIFNLLNTFNEPDRISKIQGLINNMMSFMGEDLALITGPYDNLLSLDDVIDKNLILIVSLNTNVESKSTIALGRILLQNLQLM
ncbi:MAG: type IV secretion system DNA-binding domain-containing protein, partial [Acidobacteriaceae bacterium]